MHHEAKCDTLLRELSKGCGTLSNITCLLPRTEAMHHEMLSRQERSQVSVEKAEASSRLRAILQALETMKFTSRDQSTFPCALSKVTFRMYCCTPAVYHDAKHTTRAAPPLVWVFVGKKRPGSAPDHNKIPPANR
jgi:hypothetical protein